MGGDYETRSSNRVTWTFRICAVPSALHAQDRDDHYRHQRYERYDRYDRHDRGGYRDGGYAYRDGGYAYGYQQAPCSRDRRGSVDRSIAIVGGSAAAGALIGAAAGHGPGAAIGAFIGGMTGLIVDQSTRGHRDYDRY